MKLILVLFLSMLLVNCKENGTSSKDDQFSLVKYDAVPVEKTNNIKVYMHYMPWFESPEINGRWGVHWTMANKNPDIIDNNGRREIASHFYPLIGPYSSMDKDVIEYHLLLMKLCGVDGLLIDWYGTFDVYDYKQNFLNSEALIDQLNETGLDFAIVYEEFTAEKVADQNKAASAIAAAKTDLKYMNDNFFTNNKYIKINSVPLLLTFGPRYFKQEDEWSQIFSDVSPKPVFLTLMNQSRDAGKNADGEFAWVTRNHLADLNMFYTNRTPVLKYTVAAAYPGFYDYYSEGGWDAQELGWQIRYDGTATLSATLDKAEQSGLNMLQLVTWNDFGEGTMLEPTIEFGYTQLEVIQQFAGVPFARQDLELVMRLYQYRKQFHNDKDRQLKLDQVFYYIVSLQIENAKNLLDKIE